MKMRSNKVNQLVLMAVFGAWAIVLRLFDFPILPAAPFLKVDFSDLMVLIGLLVKGPMGAISVALIRDTANYLMKGGEVGLPIGVMMSFIASMAMFLPNHYLLHSWRRLNKKIRYLFMSMTLVIGLVVSMGLINYYVALPIYVTVMNFPIPDITDYLLTVILPFNFLKGFILAGGQLFVLEKVWPLIAKRNLNYPAYIHPSLHSNPAK